MSTLNRRTILSIVPLLVSFASPASFASEAVRAAEEDSIREAVFRHQFQYNASGQRQHANAYCLSIRSADKNTDPSDEFMKRFYGQTPPVRKGSECHWTQAHVVENRTGKPALIFSISKITWVSDTEVIVDGGYAEAGLSSSGNTYTVKKRDGKWTVTEDRMDWISKDDSSHQPLGRCLFGT